MLHPIFLAVASAYEITALTHLKNISGYRAARPCYIVLVSSRCPTIASICLIASIATTDTYIVKPVKGYAAMSLTSHGVSEQVVIIPMLLYVAQVLCTMKSGISRIL
jgi:hypothetical protein